MDLFQLGLVCTIVPTPIVETRTTVGGPTM